MANIRESREALLDAVEDLLDRVAKLEGKDEPAKRKASSKK